MKTRVQLSGYREQEKQKAGAAPCLLSSIPCHINIYLDHLTVRSYSQVTIKCYRSKLNKFVFYLKKNGIEDISDITKEIIRDYQIYLYQQINCRGEQNSIASQINDLKVVKSYMRFLHEREYIAIDPSRDIPYARLPKRLPRSILSKTEMKKLLCVPDTGSVLGYRDRTILEVLYSTAIRKKEIIELTVQDVDYTEGLIRVIGKGNKERVVPAGKIACRYLENYIKAVRPALVKRPGQSLFVSIYGNRLSMSGLAKLIRKNSLLANIKKKVTPHTFRHTCATLMLKNKANIRHIQELLGHAALNSTQIYTRVTIVDLKEVHKRCHPRERDRK